jgi:hypothetical protein
LRIRTVLDCRWPGTSRRYLLRTLLLAHSWAALDGDQALEVVVIGAVPPAVDARLHELGAEVTSSNPHPLDPVSRFANKLVGLREAGSSPVVLVDNDVFFNENVSDLQGRNVRASVTSTRYITDEQWAHIATAAHRQPLTAEWASLRDEIRARKRGRAPAVHRRLNLNSGVVWTREPVVLESLWAASLAAIADAFEGHPLATHWVRGDDQVGLDVAVAELGGFDLLPYAYNWRTRCFGLGLEETPKILHLSDLFVSELPFAAAVTEYWQRRVIKLIKRLKGKLDGQDDRLLDEAVSIRDRVLRVGAEADLDAFTIQ